MSSSSSDADAEPPVTTLETGAFAGLPFPHASARANALHVVREHVSTYLITHPHLDHLSGFVINTAAFHNTSRPKRLAALPFTVAAIKTHIFNNIVWPNLTDEDGGVGLVTFQRLQEGGNIALGEGSGRGYIEVCDGLGVRGFKVSHGHCMKGTGHVHRGSAVGAVEGQMQMPAMGIHRASTYQSDGHAVQIADGREARSLSFSLPTQSAPGTPLYSGTNAPDPSRRGSIAGTHAAAHANGTQCVIDSSAYFIRTSPTSTSTTPSSPNKEREILIFGDVEPDSLSLSPRTYHIWAEAAPKIAAGVLTGIFIECSYTNAQGDAVLYGHLAPRHLLAELQNLADMVREARRELEREREEARKGRKRKRASNGLIAASESDVARKSSRSRTYNIPADTNDEIMTDPPPASPTPNGARTRAHTPAVAAETGVLPLRGVKVVVMHVKDTLADGPLVGEQILNELIEGERERGLGCAFDVAVGGGSYWF
jgi:cAMP phosphodiesterase